MTTLFARPARGTLTAAVDDRVAVAAPYVLGTARIVIGFLFASHGVSSLFGVWGRDAVAVGAWPGFYAAVIQLVCGVLVAAGVGSRSAAFVGSGSMAYAYFSVHQEAGLLPITNGGEPAAMFCWTLLALAATGPGALRVDSFLSRLRAAGSARLASAPSSVGAGDTADDATAPAATAATAAASQVAA